MEVEEITAAASSIPATPTAAVKVDVPAELAVTFRKAEGEA